MGDVENAFVSNARKHLCLTQFEFAEKLKVDQTSVSRWERGLSTPRPIVISAIRKLVELHDKGRDYDRRLAMVRHNAGIAAIFDTNLVITEISELGAQFFQSRHGPDGDLLNRMSLEQYLRKASLSHLNVPEYIRVSGLLQGGALYLRCLVNVRGKGNSTVYEPIYRDGSVEGLYVYVTYSGHFPDNDDITCELVEYVPANAPETLRELHRGDRSHALIPQIF
ncbi:DNA-binding transcriptional regulator [Celeribacter sp. PS-C1]|uniref:helix-turn-helix domain-containing protein n=1 Tax=Celeribacter sp. PS-C1 TaxID=2820813 RepID=UPI0021078F1E|nr:helix-turn-helix transcriptional regulator [Celeribacter sp. PS-C1]